MATDRGICWVGTPNTPLSDGEKRIRAEFHVEKFERDDTFPMLLIAKSQLEKYVVGKNIPFTVPLDIKGTEFQQAVWKTIAQIPYGETRTYTQIAQQIGRPKAVRAVGSACGVNPVPIIIPCHRVVASNGGLGGYSGGLEVKKCLLGIEGCNVTL